MGHLSRNQMNRLLVLCTMCEKCMYFISANTDRKPNSEPTNSQTSTGLFEMIIGVVTTCHTQYT